MKAAVVRAFDRPLEIEDLPIPDPGAGQVLVRVEACGLCHTDIHAARGEWPVKPSPPFIPGHEGVGVIERLGDGPMYGLELGMRVALPWLGYACGVCRYCNSGRETLCLDQKNMGYALNGGFAEYALGYARHVVRVPDGIDPADAAPLTCAGVTTYKAVKDSGARSSSLVAVFGVGGLGHLAVQYARITGASVIAVDVNPARLESARAVGADYVINALEEDPVAAIGSSSEALTTCSAPSSRAVSRRASLTSTATTAAPVMRAYWTARWPRPPMPKMATRSEGRMLATLMALYVVTPAQVKGAASCALTPSGTSTT